MSNEQFDPKRRAADKQLSRDQDAADLAGGRVSAEELQDKNRFLQGFDPARGKIRKWKKFK